jgi:hypothetical protein
MTADKPRYLDLRLPDGALRKTTIKSNCSGAIVALQAEKVNHNPTGRRTERGMVPQSVRNGKSAIKKRRSLSYLCLALSSTIDVSRAPVGETCLNHGHLRGQDPVA